MKMMIAAAPVTVTKERLTGSKSGRVSHASDKRHRRTGEGTDGRRSKNREGLELELNWEDAYALADADQPYDFDAYGVPAICHETPMAYAPLLNAWRCSVCGTVYTLTHRSVDTSLLETICPRFIESRRMLPCGPVNHRSAV